jgi:threonine synthase
MERLRHLFPDFERLADAFRADSVSDDVIRNKIREGEERYGQQWCPHTATAVEIYEQQVARGNPGPWVMVATAHPAKFETIVEPLIGNEVPVPQPLADLLSLPSHKTDIGPNYDAFREHLLTA